MGSCGLPFVAMGDQVKIHRDPRTQPVQATEQALGVVGVVRRQPVTDLDQRPWQVQLRAVHGEQPMPLPERPPAGFVGASEQLSVSAPETGSRLLWPGRCTSPRATPETPAAARHPAGGTGPTVRPGSPRTLAGFSKTPGGRGIAPRSACSANADVAAIAGRSRGPPSPPRPATGTTVRPGSSHPALSCRAAQRVVAPSSAASGNPDPAGGRKTPFGVRPDPLPWVSPRNCQLAAR